MPFHHKYLISQMTNVTIFNALPLYYQSFLFSDTEHSLLIEYNILFILLSF
jgi:hypothetical protein